MAKVQAVASTLIAAPADTIYGVLVDYRQKHPQILPRPPFSDLTIEQGGVGAGTIIRFHTNVMGMKRHFRMVVAEPEPGRVLTETDEAKRMLTTFTVLPVQNGAASQVEIKTEWESTPGLLGWLDKTFMPPMMAMTFKRQFKLIAAYVGQKEVATR